MVPPASLLAFAIASLALGIGALVAQSIVVFTIIEFAGAAYLVYLGVQAIRHRRHAAVTHEAVGARRPRIRILLEGFVVGLTKACGRWSQERRAAGSDGRRNASNGWARPAG
jgi:threonine/homoserine/homoserine lactone efflux protein